MPLKLTATVQQFKDYCTGLLPALRNLGELKRVRGPCGQLKSCHFHHMHPSSTPISLKLVVLGHVRLRSEAAVTESIVFVK